MSKNHQYIELQDKVYSRYIKTGVAILSGMRSDPYDPKNRIPYILKTPDSVVIWQEESDNEGNTHLVVPQGRKPIIYEDEVLEVYSEAEDRVFKQLNRKLIESGDLIPYHEERLSDINMSNALSDNDIVLIANSATIPIFKKKIKTITSAPTLLRIDQKLTELGRKPSFKQALAEHQNTIQEPI